MTQTNDNTKGTLYLVSTPIGNMGDITLRALDILKGVDIVAAEDTRQTMKLFNRYTISKPLVSYHEHNRAMSGDSLIQKLESGLSIALVTDAGTPGISDPGEDLVKLAVSKGISVSAIPGPVAAVAGLVLSGLPAGRYSFEGFLSANRKIRRERLSQIRHDDRTLVFYEAPHKLIRTLGDLLEAFGDRKIAVARELTKKFEEVIRCNISEALNHFTQKPPKGEIVLVIEGYSAPAVKAGAEDIDKAIDSARFLITQGIIKKEALRMAAKESGISRRNLYKRMVDIQNTEG